MLTTLRERFELAVARGEADEAEVIAHELDARHGDRGGRMRRAVQALRDGDHAEAWSEAVEARPR